MNNEIRSGYYRVSVKALILNETRDKFLIVKKDNGKWVTPGGGLEWGEDAHEGLSREIREEMGLATSMITEHPSYFLTCKHKNKEEYIANVVYETELQSLEFTPTEECVEICFVDEEDVKKMENVSTTTTEFAKQFDARRHVRKM